MQYRKQNIKNPACENTENLRMQNWVWKCHKVQKNANPNAILVKYRANLINMKFITPMNEILR